MHWIRFFFHYSFFAAVCAVALCVETALRFNLRHNPWLYILVFGATLCSYNLHWLLGSTLSQTAQSLFKAIWHKGKGYLLVLLPGLCTAAIALWQLPALWIAIWPAVMASILYSLPLLPHKASGSLRKWGGVKTLLLAATWTYVTVIFTLLEANVPLSVLPILQRFVFILLLCLLFDLRDVDIDQERGIHSLATQLGSPHSQRFFIFTWVVYIVCSIALVQTASNYIVIALLALAVLVMFRAAKQSRGYWFYYLGVDGLMIFSALLHFLIGF
jgi:4-hydroxybenzoate polyprenyltransferase